MSLSAFSSRLVVCLFSFLIISCEDREDLIAQYSQHKESIHKRANSKMEAGDFDGAYWALKGFDGAVENREFKELFIRAEEGKLKAELKSIPVSEAGKNLERYKRLVELRPGQKLYQNKVAFYEAQERKAEEDKLELERVRNEQEHTTLIKLRMISAAKNKIKALLKDPSSAEFGKMAVVKKGEIMVVCGLVNARNSFGGYIGEQPFISNGLNITFLREHVSDFAELWNELCVGGEDW